MLEVNCRTQGAVLAQLGRPVLTRGPAEAITDAVGRGDSTARVEWLKFQRHNVTRRLGQSTEKREGGLPPPTFDFRDRRLGHSRLRRERALRPSGAAPEIPDQLARY